MHTVRPAGGKFQVGVFLELDPLDRTADRRRFHVVGECGNFLLACALASFLNGGPIDLTYLVERLSDEHK